MAITLTGKTFDNLKTRKNLQGGMVKKEKREERNKRKGEKRIIGVKNSS